MIVSNRLPVRVSIEEGAVTLASVAGGLTSALDAVAGATSWIGWPGGVVPLDEQAATCAVLRDHGLSPVFLDEDEEREYYGRVCNDTLWPLFHYVSDRLRVTEDAWHCYQRVNERFAAEVAASAPWGSSVWIHDFHLTLVPALVRERRPDLRIGFFLHVPFPSSEIIRVLPQREQVLRGMLGADLVSFHTADYARHFRSACLRVLGLDSEPDAIDLAGRRVCLGVDPIGVDVAGFEEVLAADSTATLLAELETLYADRTLLLGIERLDPTKGIPQKLLAYERFLERDPARATSTTLVQVVVPSRLDSDEYRALRSELELIIARVNGRFGRPGVTPVEYIHRAIPRDELAALYRRADVMLVTPVRDGMNLVAHEFVLCQSTAGPGPSRRGALVLSELAGAAQVLPGAHLVNPWDQAGVVERIEQALTLSVKERGTRLETMERRVRELDSRKWASRFLARLARSSAPGTAAAVPKLSPEQSGMLHRRFVSAEERVVVLGYDGALRELERVPELAVPSPELLRLLERLCAAERTAVHLVSGRASGELDAWFGALPLTLCAEYGFSVRHGGESRWREEQGLELGWLEDVESFLRGVAADVPGALVERKGCGVAWHYRDAEPEYGAWRTRELLPLLAQRAAAVGAELVTGHRVVEVRVKGVSVGDYLRRLLTAPNREALLLAVLADDAERQASEVLPADAVLLGVGACADARGSVCERHRLATPSEARRTLDRLLLP